MGSRVRIRLVHHFSSFREGSLTSREFNLFSIAVKVFLSQFSQHENVGEFDALALGLKYFS